MIDDVDTFDDSKEDAFDNADADSQEDAFDNADADDEPGQLAEGSEPLAPLLKPETFGNICVQH